MQNNVDTNNEPIPQWTVTPNETLQMALDKRERFLKHHPHLRAYQAQIDRVLDKSGNHQGRLAVLGTLMQGKLVELQEELYKLNNIIHHSVTSR